MKHFTLVTTLLISLFIMAGCSSADKPVANVAAPKTSEPAKPAAAAEPAAVTGVAACDEYLVKLEKFMTNPNVPQSTRDMYKQSLEQNRNAWKQAASTPQGKAGLETSCKMALDAIKPTLEQFAK